MRIPDPDGPLSRIVTTHLRTVPASSPPLSSFLDRAVAAVGRVTDPLRDRDLQLALATCYELHYRGFDDVADEHEWQPSTVALTALLEDAVKGALRAAVPLVHVEPTAVPRALRTLVEADCSSDVPSLSTYLLRQADEQQFRDFLVQRSVYHLKEADPHTWAIPRLHGTAKAALVEIQADEYGGGRPGAMHASLFAQTMRALGLIDDYGAYWSDATAETFATSNVMTLFGLHRRHRAAALGHLAALEMTSTLPNRRYSNALRRLGHGLSARAYFDEHVEADAVHEQIASVDMCGSFAAAEPNLAAEVVWGAACCLLVDRLAGSALLARWGADSGASSTEVA